MAALSLRSRHTVARLIRRSARADGSFPQPSRCALWAFLFVSIGVSLAASVAAQGPAAADRDSGRVLQIGTKQIPPFAIKREGDWTGVSIALWREFADELDLEYEFVELPLNDLMTGLEDGSLDAAVAALTMTSDRESRFDFSYAFLVTGLGIGVPVDDVVSAAKFFRRFTAGPFVRIFGLSILALTAASIALWFFEAKSNPEHFGGGIAEGIGSALWWSVVTMTTVGYGDKAPRTAAGRVLAVVWMIAGVILISALTASITSALTVSQLATSIAGPRELAGQNVGTIEGSTSARYLRRNGVPAALFDSLEECVDAMHEGNLDAVVYDAVLLRYYGISHPDRAFPVVPGTFKRQSYGIGLPQGSALREPLNRFILRHLQTDEWSNVLTRYTGAEGAEDS
jgi:polar amino acid transport system substrate-binding protein